MSNREVRKALRNARKDLRDLSTTVIGFKKNALELQLSLKEISLITFYASTIFLVLVPTKSQMLWAFAFIKADIGAGMAIAGGSAVAIGTVGVIAVSSSGSSNIKKVSPAIENKVVTTLVANTDVIKSEEIKNPVIFEPKKAKLIKIDAEELEGIITTYNKDYVVIKVNNLSQIIPQKDIYHIEW